MNSKEINTYKITEYEEWEFKHYLYRKFVEIRNKDYSHNANILMTVAKFKHHPSIKVRIQNAYRDEFKEYGKDKDEYIFTYGQNNTTVWSQHQTILIESAITHAINLLKMMENII